MKIYRCPNDKVVVVVSEIEGVTDDDIGDTLSKSDAFQSLFTAVNGECEGILPLGSPFSTAPYDILRSTVILFPAPAVMWFQLRPDYWQWVPLHSCK